MGGKTQQRVAGNVKPSNSGRIRELLESNQGAGNMITFSVLSNGKQPTTLKQPDEPKKTESPRRRPPPSAHRGVFKPPAVVETFDSVTSNREIEKRLEDELKSERNSLGESDQLNSRDDKDPSIEDEPEEEPEQTYNFDEILSELDTIQANIRQSDVKSLHELDEASIEHEQNLIKLLGILVSKFKDEMSIEDWDLINRSLNRFIGLVSSSELALLKPRKAEFCKSIFDFVHQLIEQAKLLSDSKADQDESSMTQLILEDWKNFYSSQIYKDLITLFFSLASTESTNPGMRSILESLSAIISAVDPKYSLHDENLTKNLSANIEFDHELDLPENCTYLALSETKFRGFIATCGLLRSNHRAVLIASHSMLSKTIDGVCDWVRASVAIDQDENDKMLLVPPAALMSILTSRDSIMSALLSDYRDVSVTMEPNSDSYSCTLAYLFTWDLVIRFIVGMNKEVGHQMIHCFKRLGLTQRLLDHIFMLLPPLDGRDALNLRLLETDKAYNLAGLPWRLSDFLKLPLSCDLKRRTLEIELTALHIYFSVALHMPVTVRKWFNNNSNRRLCNLVNEYTAKHISKIVCSLEMETVQEKCRERAKEYKENNLVIRARPSAKEVYATYTRDEFKLELIIRLPANYPLSPVEIDGGKRVGVTDVKWRSWLLQLTTFLSHQNGPILDGIDLWRRNIDKRFEGLEKCMICFSILNSNYQLPKKKCATCSHTFHNLCLYKWFETSGNTTCALCRSIWRHF